MKPDVRTGRNQAKTWLTPDQIQELRNACLSSEVPTYLQDQREALLELLYDTGVRRDELAQLNVEHLDLAGDQATVYLPGEIQKRLPNGEYRQDATLGLADQTANALRRYLRDRWKDTEALFPTRSSDQITGRSVTRAVKRLAEIAEVNPRVVGGGRGDPQDVTAHTLRHSVAYRIIQVEGGRLEDVQLRLRHRTREVTDRLYSHLIPR